jgi:hypothetical protein
MKVHFSPVLKPAPPRPRRPEFLIWSQIHSGGIDIMSATPFQTPRCFDPSRPQSWRP